MPAPTQLDFTVTGVLDPSAISEIKRAAANANMSVDDYVLGSALQSAAFSSVMTGYRQAKQGDFYEGTVEDVITEAKEKRANGSN